MLPELSDLLTYQNQHVLNRYKKDYPSNKLKCKEAFTEMLKYLWVCEKHRQDKEQDPNNPDLDFTCDIHFEMEEVDHMWHTFILFTREYTEFGQKYFGKYLHHAPNVEDKSPVNFEEQFTRYLSYIYDNLGEETLKTWFSEYL